METGTKTLRQLTEELTLRDSLLIESEKTFRTIFCICPIPLLVTTVDEGKIVKCNQALCEITKYRESELIGKTAIELNIYANNEDRDGIVKEIHEKGSVKGRSVVYQDRYGKKYNTSFNAKIINISGKKHFMAAIVIKDEVC